MDLQLYQIEVNNYLVDFRNLGYKLIPPSSSASVVDEDGHQRQQRTTPQRNGAASSPFLFLECACRLIVELAVGPPEP